MNECHGCSCWECYYILYRIKIPVNDYYGWIIGIIYTNDAEQSILIAVMIVFKISDMLCKLLCM